MKQDHQSPRIHTNDESFMICANRSGLIELRDQISHLLDNELSEISLGTMTSSDISTICLDDELKEPAPQSFKSTLFILTSLFFILFSLLVGICTILSWLW